MSVEKMYILVRQDIAPGYQIAQSVHAKDQFTHEYPEIENKWYRESNTIVVLGVTNEETLGLFVDLAEEAELKYSLFYEPDIDEHTALGLEPSPRTAELVSMLKPAGRRRKKGAQHDR